MEGRSAFYPPQMWNQNRAQNRATFPPLSGKDPPNFKLKIPYLGFFSFFMIFLFNM